MFNIIGLHLEMQIKTTGFAQSGLNNNKKIKHKQRFVVFD